MTLHVLDTDTLTLLQERHAGVIARIAAYSPNDIAVTVISVEEQLSGWYRRLRRAKKPEDLASVYQRLTDTVRSLSRLPILTYTESAIRRAKTLQASKLNVRKMDLSIAAIALERQAVVVTRNIRDFGRVPILIVEDWSK
jgi:tRNA(fMet)-specific endonuclease VapC